jgi:cytochrome bd-type quinol oxidase subunit 1
MFALWWRRVVKNQHLQSDQEATKHSNTLSIARVQLVGQVQNKHIIILLLGWLCHCYGMALVCCIITNSLTAFTYNKHLHSCSLLITLYLLVAAYYYLLIIYFLLLFTRYLISSLTIVYLLQPTLINPCTVSHCNGNIYSPDTNLQLVS